MEAEGGTLELAIVDVRDLADLHLRAMTSPAAKGQRFLGLSDGTMTLLEVARFVHRERPDLTPRAASKRLPTCQLRLASLFNARAKGMLSLVGVNRRASNDKAKKLQGWAPRTKEETLLAAVESLERHGLLKR